MHPSRGTRRDQREPLYVSDPLKPLRHHPGALAAQDNQRASVRRGQSWQGHAARETLPFRASAPVYSRSCSRRAARGSWSKYRTIFRTPPSTTTAE